MKKMGGEGGRGRERGRIMFETKSNGDSRQAEKRRNRTHYETITVLPNGELIH